MRINGYDEDHIVTDVPKEQIGLFDLAYQVDNPSDEFLMAIIEWLSYNCTGHFIVLEDRRINLAGGTTDNRQSFEYGHFDLKKQRDYDLNDLRALSCQIRMDRLDNMMFRLRWIVST